MGLCCSADGQQQMEQFDYLQHHQLHHHNERKQLIDHNLLPNSQYGIRMGVAMMMEQATALAKAPPGVEVLTLESEIRKAKAEGRTVTITNGCVYFDYQLVGRISSDTNFHA
ncbi:unnamed protein product [Cercopithifilaria johnstoni]|uniref:Uncharacterized protein n=1 Tax=Cercopithifilaria johnstoni TaxID=2874296 RepID=A0A8J2PZ27_9BILA|nr:unnamed protein product [Cercopithifilaria johnstoni]